MFLINLVSNIRKNNNVSDKLISLESQVQQMMNKLSNMEKSVELLSGQKSGGGGCDDFSRDADLCTTSDVAGGGVWGLETMANAAGAL